MRSVWSYRSGIALGLSLAVQLLGMCWWAQSTSSWLTCSPLEAVSGEPTADSVCVVALVRLDCCLSGWYPVFKAGADDLGQQALYLKLCLSAVAEEGPPGKVTLLVSGWVGTSREEVGWWRRRKLLDELRATLLPFYPCLMIHG